MAILKRKSDQSVIFQDCRVADSFLLRLKGLVGVRKKEFGYGLLFPNCNSIHMWMMSIPIDVVFMKQLPNQEYAVVKTCDNLKPWKFLPALSFSADTVLEVPVGSIELHRIQKGEILCFAL
jgi:uncharacterized membrane protein (UPF0127 family)